MFQFSKYDTAADAACACDVGKEKHTESVGMQGKYKLFPQPLSHIQ